MTPGGPTGAAIPLVWVHAEYIKLARSIADHRVFDTIDPVRARYSAATRAERVSLEIWSAKRPVSSIDRASRLRVIAGVPFTLRWTSTEWRDEHQVGGSATALGVWFADVPPTPSSAARLLLRLSGDGTETQAVVDLENASLPG